MLGLKWKPSRSTFNARLLTTFGKLDEQDIDDINGCQQRLAVHLINRYGWNTEEAQAKVDRFSSSLSVRPHVLTSGQTID